VKHCAAFGHVLCPYLTVMRFDDGSRDGQSHPHFLSGGEKQIKKSL
jgi:hypothetical protein